MVLNSGRIRHSIIFLIGLAFLASCRSAGKPSPEPASPAPSAAESPPPAPSPSPLPPEKSIITLLVKESKYNGSDRLDSYVTSEWDASGKILLSKTTHDGQRSAIQGKTVYEHDASGRVTMETVYGPENALKYKLVSAYDGSGRKIEEKRRDPRGTVILTSRFSYDENGNRTSWKIFMGETDLVGETQYRYEGGFLNRITMRARDNEYRGMIEIVYDKKGREISRTNISVRGTTESYEEYAYEGDRRVGETKTGITGKVLLAITMEYGKDGYIFKRTVRNDKGKVKEYAVFEYERKEASAAAR
jgi:hypothetical protein